MTIIIYLTFQRRLGNLYGESYPSVHCSRDIFSVYRCSYLGLFAKETTSCDQS